MVAENIVFSYGKNEVLHGVSLEIPVDKITTVIGANGCGKSTLFNVMTKNLKPQQGRVTLGGKDIAEIPLKQLARQIAIVHQYNTAPSDLTVERLVSYGRIAYGGFKRDRSEDERQIAFAMQITGITELAKRQISELSGGQRQRVWIAVALAQNTKILFLDEPTTYLDIRYQIDILRLVRELNQKYGITIIMVLHDINQAIAYSDFVVAMREGNIVAGGAPNEIITEELLKDVYDIELKVREIDGQVYVLG